MKVSPENFETVELVKAVLEKRYSEHITYDGLAKEFHVSKNKLKYDFKKQYTKTIYDYLTEVRVEKAKELLSTSSKPVKAIAYLVGYHESNLEKNFKRLTGMVPLEWRRLYSNYGRAW
jgi:two-component system response regulator YesN